MSRGAPLVLAALAAVVLVLMPARAQDSEPPPVRAGTDSAVTLRAPRREESVSFVVFGDRTGGKPEGVRVLERAVETANRLDPDFVMTVGDLVQGYAGPDAWIPQMTEYKAAMARLKAPWYPVAGNHDVYGGKAHPAGNADLWKQHFGPLWYSFDHAWAHVVCLFSDEALSFADPAKDQNFTDAQVEWLAKDLAETKAEQVFVFLHHPRWLYEGTNWPRVHELLVKDGRCRAVVCGHLHTYRDDGVKDGIRYVVLAMTGGETGNPLTETAAVQHVAHVRVRRDRFAMALIPVGAESGIDRVLGAELDAMNDLVRGAWLSVEGAPRIGPDAGRKSAATLVVTNPTDRALDWTATLAAPAGWTVEPQQAGGRVAAGATAKTRIAFTAPAWSASAPRPTVPVEAQVTYTTASGLRQPVRATAEIAAKLASIRSSPEARPGTNKVVVLDGKSAVRVPLEAQATALPALTAECWARSPGSAKAMAVLGRAESSSFVLFWNPTRRGRTAPSADLWQSRMPGTKRAGYVWAGAQEAVPADRWTHLALVWDAAKLRLYVDGARADEVDAPGPMTTNALPFYVGGQPEKGGGFADGFVGEIDEVRISRVARYSADFKPARVHARDADTVLLLHFDTFEDGLFLDDSGNEDHGWPAGSPRIETGRR